MQRNDIMFQNYASSENIVNSSSATDSQKSEALRRQALILLHLTRDTSAKNQSVTLVQHLKKLNFGVGFYRARAQAVDSMLKDLPQQSSLSNQIEVIDFFNLEPDCSGTYESCRQTELTNALLRPENGCCSTLASTRSIEIARPDQAPKYCKTLSAYLRPQPSLNNATASNYRTQEKQKFTDPQEPATKDTTIRATSDFRTAREELIQQNLKKFGDTYKQGNNAAMITDGSSTPLFNYGISKKSLGARRNVRANFVPPVRGDDATCTPTSTPPDTELVDKGLAPVDERLINIDPKMIELITNEIMLKSKPVDWSDIAGLDYAKSIIKEAVVYPLLRPDIFTGLRRPPRGILLFGPPGTGKTLIGKCIASSSQSTFFSISASSLTSKWMGESEKMVRALFAVAAVYQPSVVFIDEIDSLLSQRSESEQEGTRRLKTEFLVQLDGTATCDDDRILIVGATNRPQELDDAARRRLVRRLYIPLPELKARIQILTNLLQTVRNDLSRMEINEIGNLSVSYSCADIESLCREASMEPIRSIPAEEIKFFSEEKVRPVSMQDFKTALRNVLPSVSQDDLKQYMEWNRIYGSTK